MGAVLYTKYTYCFLLSAFSGARPLRRSNVIGWLAGGRIDHPFFGIFFFLIKKKRDVFLPKVG